MKMVSTLLRVEEGFLAPQTHPERKKRASLEMTGVRRMLLLLPLLALFASQAEAQAVPLESIQSQAELDKVITTLDAALIDADYLCVLEKLDFFFADDVEMYY